MNRKNGSLAIIVILTLCMFFCSGCSDISFSDNTLIRPPRTTGDKAEIQDIISDEAGGAYTLKYPQNGEYRSAVIMYESKQTAECAVALYSTENDSNISVSVISYINNRWKCIGTFTSAASGVDRVMFKDINGDKKDELIIGWSNYNNQKKLSAYTLESNDVREMAIDETYSEMSVADITGDGLDDIVLLSLSTTDTPSSAKLLQYSEQEKRPMCKFSLELDSSVTAFSSVIVGKIDDNQIGIVVDGEKAGGILLSQIIYFDKNSKTLENPLFNKNKSDATNVTTRKDIITSRDMDNDGIIEVPVVTQMSASSEDKASTVCSVTTWKQLKTSDSSLKTKLNTVINYTDAYYFIMPNRWNGAVTAKTDPENRQMTFYLWNSKTSSKGDKLLTLYRFTQEEWAKTDKSNLIQLSDVKDGTSKAVFAAQIFKTNAKDALNITQDEVVGSTKSIIE